MGYIIMKNTVQNIQQVNTKQSKKMHKEFRKNRKMPAKKCWQAI